MSENNPVSDTMARRILRSISFTENFRGDNVRRTKDSVYIGGGGGDRAGVRNYPFAPRPFIVKEVKDEYLLCRPYLITDETEGEKEVKVALPPHLRKAYNDGEARTILPGYVPDTTVVWAAHFRNNGSKDEDDNNIVLMEINVEARTTTFYWAKVTASSSSTADITLAEVDSAGDVLADGRTPADARVPNERKGVPVDTFGMAFEFAPTPPGEDVVTKFVPWDGITTSPKELIDATDDANTIDWDIEVDSEPVTYEPARVYIANDTFSVFHRELTADASGMTTIVSDETRGGLVGDAGLTSLDGHITLRPYAGGPADKLKVALNEPQADHRTLVFVPGTGIDLNGGTANVEVEFDDSGRALIANAGADQSITINATGGGSADGQGYEDVHLNGASVEATTDGGIIDFRDDQTASAGAAKVDYTVTGDAAGTATVKGEVDIDAYLKSLGGYDAGKTQVLTNTSGTIGWTDTAECP